MSDGAWSRIPVGPPSTTPIFHHVLMTRVGCRQPRFLIRVNRRLAADASVVEEKAARGPTP
jgi:hypothetical protein